MKNVPPFNRIALGLLPTTPAPFTDPDYTIISWGRMLTYGSIAALTWNKARALSWAMIGCTGLSLLTSLSAEAMKSNQIAEKPSEPTPEIETHG